MVSIPQAILRFIQFIWIILITSLIGNVLAGKTGTNSTVNYAMYVAAFTWIAWFVGIAAIFIEGLAIPAVVFVLDLLAAIFTFVAGVVLAKKLEGAHSCNNDNYTFNNGITRDGGSPKKRCRELQASTAFFWFLWACFTASMVISGLQAKNGGGMGRMRGSKRNDRGNQKQNMTQVQA